MPNDEITLETTPPVGELGIIALKSCEEIGEKVNAFLVDWRNKRADGVTIPITLAGYKSDSYLISAKTPRFGSGEAKGRVDQSIRGIDLYILVDVMNHGLTYTVCGKENHMSPDDHYADLKRIIAAVGCNCLSFPIAAAPIISR